MSAEKIITINVASDEINYLKCNEKGRIIESGDTDPGRDAWVGVSVDLSVLEEGSYPLLSFNERENKREGKDPVWVNLNYKITSLLFE